MSFETDRPALGFGDILTALTVVGEPTRLRLVALLAESELTVTDMVTILGQSQPRVSRHLKILTDAGVIERHREGAWAFFRLAADAPAGGLVDRIMAQAARDDSVFADDRHRLEETRRARSEQAARYFTRHAGDWDQIRSLHVPEEQVEAAIREAIGTRPLDSVLDLGTGTGRMLELLAPRAARCVGVDQSPAMLAVARDRVDRLSLRNVQLRQGDIYALPTETNAFDLVVIHQVLHYLDDPARALRSAARALRPGGRIVVVDFAPHEEEFLRERHAHRRLGFDAAEIADLLSDCGLDIENHHLLRPENGAANKLIVSLWVGRDRRIRSDALPPSRKEVA